MVEHQYMSQEVKVASSVGHAGSSQLTIRSHPGFCPFLPHPLSKINQNIKKLK